MGFTHLVPNISECPLPTDLQQTVVAPNRDVPDDAILDLQPTGSSGNITRQCDESTRKLLHRRLFIVTTSMLCVLLVLKLVGLVFAGTTLYDFLMRMTPAIALAGVAAVLHRLPHASLRQLRVLESVGGIVVAADVVWVLVAETRGAIATGGLESLRW